MSTFPLNACHSLDLIGKKEGELKRWLTQLSGGFDVAAATGGSLGAPAALFGGRRSAGYTTMVEQDTVPTFSAGN